jgi:hypothetical protein
MNSFQNVALIAAILSLFGCAASDESSHALPATHPASVRGASGGAPPEVGFMIETNLFALPGDAPIEEEGESQTGHEHHSAKPAANAKDEHHHHEQGKEAK